MLRLSHAQWQLLQPGAQVADLVVHVPRSQDGQVVSGPASSMRGSAGTYGGDSSGQSADARAGGVGRHLSWDPTPTNHLALMVLGPADFRHVDGTGLGTRHNQEAEALELVAVQQLRGVLQRLCPEPCLGAPKRALMRRVSPGLGRQLQLLRAAGWHTLVVPFHELPARCSEGHGSTDACAAEVMSYLQALLAL